MKLVFIILVSIFLISCQKSEESIEISPIEVVGLTEYGNVLVGESIKTKITLNNQTGSVMAAGYNFGPEITVVPRSLECSLNSVPAKTSCVFDFYFSPIDVVPYFSNLQFGEGFINFSGTGISSGEVEIDVNSISFGNISAGQLYTDTINITNIGGITSGIPKVTSPTGVLLGDTDCENSLEPMDSCYMTFEVSPTTAGSYNENIVLELGTQTLSLLVTGNIAPAEASGSISVDMGVLSGFSLSSMPVNMTTFLITDQYGNVVSDGEEVTVSVYPDSLDIDGSLKTVTKNTVGGVISFDLSPTTQSGYAAFSISSGGAYSLYEFEVQP